MLGAIAGDIIGSVYEAINVLTPDFEPLFDPRCSFTDDTILTVALADSLLSGIDYIDKLKEYFRLYPRAGYGGSFRAWAKSPERRPYYSFGNGSAMRVSPIGFAYRSLDETRAAAQKSAAVTHNHPEGIKGADATASAIYLARTGASKDDIRAHVESNFGYNLGRSLDEIRPVYQFDVSCQGSVPEAIIAFLESNTYEEAVRKAISLGGDSDTIACIAGGIADAFYGGVPAEIESQVWPRLDERLSAVVREFQRRYPR